MTEDDQIAQGKSALSLPELIRARMQEHGWSYADLERYSGRVLTRGRWQQLGSGGPQKKFPDPASLTAIAAVLQLDITVVVLAAAQGVGLGVQHPGSDLARMLPPGSELLSERMRNAIVMMIGAAIAEAAEACPADYGPSHVARSAIGHGEVLNEQLQTAPNSRVIIEQAKGVLAQRGGLSIAVAFDRLRSYARNHSLRLSQVARQVIDTDLGADVLAENRPATEPKMTTPPVRA